MPKVKQECECSNQHTSVGAWFPLKLLYVQSLFTTETGLIIFTVFEQFMAVALGIAQSN